MLLDKNIHFMAIEGVIGVGKTSLARAICERWNAMFIEENFAENPFLPKFYENRSAYAFQTQLFFLLDRFKQLQNSALQSDLFHDLLVSDYTFDKDRIFASQNLTENEMTMYDQVSNALNHDIRKPSASRITLSICRRASRRFYSASGAVAVRWKSPLTAIT